MGVGYQPSRCSRIIIFFGKIKPEIASNGVDVAIIAGVLLLPVRELIGVEILLLLEAADADAHPFPINLREAWMDTLSP
jgi:hypothetical protein